MNYLRITNKGVCDPISFTTLGVSTSRKNENSIGQFGSGALHGTLVLLRNDISPIIYCGTTKMSFFTKNTTIKNQDESQTFQQVYVKIGQKTERLTVSLDFGTLDWTDVGYACREYISNALDQANQNVNDINIEIVDHIEPCLDKTIVYIPLNMQIEQYYHNLPNYFLHFSSSNLIKEKVLPKKVPGPPKIYRKGVFVKEVQTDSPSMFDYNFGEELKIDESRDLDSSSCQYDVIDKLIDSDKIGYVFDMLVKRMSFWETDFTTGHLSSCTMYDTDRQRKWQEIWNERFGNAVIATEDHLNLINEVKNNGFEVKVIESAGWYRALSNAGIPTILSAIDNVNDDGLLILDATKECIDTVNLVWKWLEDFNLTQFKDKPNVKCFRHIMKNQVMLMGFVTNGVVHINENYTQSRYVIMHELSHYLTSLRDHTPDFQEYAFKMATMFAEKLYQPKSTIKEEKQCPF